MARCQRMSLTPLALIPFLALFVFTPTIHAQAAEDPPIRIGMVNTLFTDVPPAWARLVLVPFGGIMREFTGMNGQMTLGGDPLSLAKDLHEGKTDLGVFHGVEFAWAQHRYKDLLPLMVACTKYRYAQAVLVVRKDCPAMNVSGLKGKVVGLPQRSREHCRLFLNKCAADCGTANPEKFFAEVAHPASVETALDEICVGNIQAAVVDLVAFEKYEDVKPGCYRRLKVLSSSEQFPTGAIAYRAGTIAETTLKKFRDGLAAANKTESGREQMRMFNITSFESVPEDYHTMLADIMKVYPSPR